jgi:hypothetical protein
MNINPLSIGDIVKVYNSIITYENTDKKSIESNESNKQYESPYFMNINRAIYNIILKFKQPELMCEYNIVNDNIEIHDIVFENIILDKPTNVTLRVILEKFAEFQEELVHINNYHANFYKEKGSYLIIYFTTIYMIKKINNLLLNNITIDTDDI